MRAAGLDTDAQGSLLSFLRKGYKVGSGHDGKGSYVLD